MFFELRNSLNENTFQGPYSTKLEKPWFLVNYFDFGTIWILYWKATVYVSPHYSQYHETAKI
jgi:hypothetical protein